eukprot:403360761
MESTRSLNSTTYSDQSVQDSLDSQEEKIELPIYLQDKPLSEMNDQEKNLYYAHLMQSVRETQRNARQNIEKSAIAKIEIEQTLKASRDVEERYEKFKSDFGVAINKLAVSLKETVTPMNVEHTHQPKQVSAIDAAQQLKNCKAIMILTGAGLSAASGIPTFRGDNGFWTKSYGNYSDPMEILTTKTLINDPQVQWQWRYDFTDIVKKCKPNAGHQAIYELQNFSWQNPTKLETQLVTQNIDNFHIDIMEKNGKKLKKKQEGTYEFGFVDEVHEIHGNNKYMKCFKECNDALYLSPEPPMDPDERKNKVPICYQCGGVMKSTTMLFDETYSEKWYRSETVSSFLQDKLDGLIVVGTALQTNFASHIVMKTLAKQNIPVIEVNTEPCITTGYTFQVKESSLTALPAMVKKLIQLKTSKPTVVKKK